MTEPFSPHHDPATASADELLLLAYLQQTATVDQELCVLDRLEHDDEFRLLFADLSAVVFPLLADQSNGVSAVKTHIQTSTAQPAYSRLLVLTFGLLIAVPVFVFISASTVRFTSFVGRSDVIAHPEDQAVRLLAHWTALNQSNDQPIDDIDEADPQDASDFDDISYDPMESEVTVPEWMLLAVQMSDQANESERIDPQPAVQEERL